MASAESTPSPERFEDRSTRLVLFGVVAIGLGLVALALGLLHFLLAFAIELLAQLGLPPSEVTVYLTGAALYFMIGAVFVGLGVGSLLKRRWVRPLMLTFAWTWLACGLVAALATPWMLDAVLLTASDAIDPDGRVLIKFVTLGLIASFGVFLPAVFVLAYRDPDVQRTCAAHDARPAWTESCPGPVLGLSVGLGACAALALPMLLRPVLPLFTWLLTGWPAGLVMLAGAAACGYLARSTYRLEMSGWWGAVVLFVLIGAATAVSLATMEPAELFRTLGYPEEQIEAIGGSASAIRTLGVGFSVAFTAATLLYMSRVRKHFVERA